jgi:hypothetical protein
MASGYKKNEKVLITQLSRVYNRQTPLYMQQAHNEKAEPLLLEADEGGGIY